MEKHEIRESYRKTKINYTLEFWDSSPEMSVHKPPHASNFDTFLKQVGDQNWY
jgi:hypothetical protein